MVLGKILHSWSIKTIIMKELIEQYLTKQNSHRWLLNYNTYESINDIIDRRRNLHSRRNDYGE